MRTTIKTTIGVLLALTLIWQAVDLVQARLFARGGQQDTYYDILACTDGLIFNVGLNVPNAPSTPRALFARVDADIDRILDGASFFLDGPSNVTIYDAASNAPIVLTHTGTLTASWLSGTGNPTVVAGMRIRVVVPEIRNAGQTIGVADSFYSIVQPCSIQNPPPDRENRVFYPPGGDAQNPGLRVPDKAIPPNSVITSTIPVTTSVGTTVADVDVGMYIYDVVPGQIKVYLVSPAGTRVKMFENLASDNFGRREINLDNDLVRDLMPDFVLDDASVFTSSHPSVAGYVDVSAIKPAEALAQLNGQDPNGDWLLEIHNLGGGSAGILGSWALDIEVEPKENRTYLPAIFRNQSSGTSGWQTLTLPTAPTAGGSARDLSGYTRKSDGSLHLVYAGADAMVHELWSSDGMVWQHVAVGQLANAPAIAGEPMGLGGWDGSGGHIVYTGTDGQIHMLTFAPGTGWAHIPIGQQASAPLAQGSPWGFVWEGVDAPPHVVYRGVDSRIHELWYNPNVDQYRHSAIGTGGSIPVADGEPIGMAWPGGGIQYILFRAVDGQIHELRFTVATSSWQHNPLGASLGATGSVGALFGYLWNGTDSRHVMYRGQDGMIHELWASNGAEWRYATPSQGAHAPAVTGSPFAYAWESKERQSVIYLGVNGAIHELDGTKAGVWTYQTLAAASSLTPGGRPVGFGVAGGARQFIFFADTSGVIHGFWKE